MSDFQVMAAYAICAIATIAALYFIARALFPIEDIDDWQSGDPGPHYGRDPKGRF